MNHRAVLILLVIEEDKVGFFVHFTVCVSQEYGYIKVKVLAAIILVGIPAETYFNFGQARVSFRQIDLLPFG
ncbi:hypothetical protein D3C80_1532310 [compost metagenome]